MLISGFHETDDDDRDIPSSMSSQIKDVKKYSFNQYSSTPQLYTSSNSTQAPMYSQYSPLAPQGGGSLAPVVSQAQNPVVGDYAGYQQQDQQRQQQQPVVQQFQQPDGRAQFNYIGKVFTYELVQLC